MSKEKKTYKEIEIELNSLKTKLRIAEDLRNYYQHRYEILVDMEEKREMHILDLLKHFICSSQYDTCEHEKRGCKGCFYNVEEHIPHID